MSIQATIQNRIFYSGARAALPPRTALLTVSLPVMSRHWTEVEPELRADIATLFAKEPLLGGHAHNLPQVFVKGKQEQDVSFADWVVALCVAFQRWARDPACQGQVVEVTGDSAQLAIPWFRQDVFDMAMQLALRHILIHYEPPLERQDKSAALAYDLGQWLQSVQPNGLAIDAMRFALAAAQRDIPVKTGSGFVQLGWGSQSERMDNSFTHRTSNLASRLARDKILSKQLLWNSGIPTSQGIWTHSVDHALEFSRTVGWPLVVKPSSLDGGVAVTARIQDESELRLAFAKAANAAQSRVIVERHIEGNDYRLLVVGGKLLVATQRVNGGVVGDGTHSVQQLVNLTNQNPLRGRDRQSQLIALDLDEEALICLRQQSLTPDSLPSADQYVFLRRTANISTGGTSVDVSHLVHPDNRDLAVRAARLTGLDIAGIDLICPDISRSWHEVGGVICEVNAQPGFRVHWLGAPERDFNGEVIDWLFANKKARIPTAAITGTNGKTTVARMLHHLWRCAGKYAGVTTTQGVWIGDEHISKDNLSGVPGANLLLDDPAVEAAIIEMPRKGLIYFGHPCDRYDVAALLNIQNDHIGVDGIQSLDEMARLKAQVLERATEAVVVNAQDELTLAMLEHSTAPRRILVSTQDDAPAFLSHLEADGEGLFLQTHQGERWIAHAQGSQITFVLPIKDVPATVGGAYGHNCVNALFAVALAWAQGLPLNVIRQGMSTFQNDARHNMGRCNFIEGLPCTTVLDFGHNPDGFEEFFNFVSKLPRTGQLRLVCMNLGNRHRQHIELAAPLIARHFDHVVLSSDPGYVRESSDYAGPDPLSSMLQAGEMAFRNAGLSPQALLVAADRVPALEAALNLARAGDLLVVLCEPEIALPVFEAFKNRSAPIKNHPQ